LENSRDGREEGECCRKGGGEEGKVNSWGKERNCKPELAVRGIGEGRIGSTVCNRFLRRERGNVKC